MKPRRSHNRLEAIFLLSVCFFGSCILLSNITVWFTPAPALLPTKTIWNLGVGMLADARYCSEFDWKDTFGDVFFVCEADLNDFALTILPNLPAPIVLVTAHTDHTLPDEKIVSKSILESPKVKVWWSQNSDQPSKVRQLPIGIDFHSRTKPSSLLTSGSNFITILRNGGLYEQSASPQVQEEELMRVKQEAPAQRELRVYADFQFNSRYGRSFRGSIRRKELFQKLQHHSLIYWSSQRSSRADSWREKVQFAFELSVPGHGLDCHRTWEALALGLIVITVRSPLDPLFEGLPVVILDNPFREITESNLFKWYQKYHPMFEDGEVQRKLTNQYWIEKIRESGR